MRLAQVVETSRQMAATTKRLEKIDRLASLLKRLSPEEVEIVVSYLSGSTRQGRIGIGYSTLRSSLAPPAGEPSIELSELDRTLDELAKVSGAGSENRKREILHQLFARATEPEQQFLSALLVGELRQGALEGIMFEALAKASGLPVERIRRAAMMAGGSAPIARVAMAEGEAGLTKYDIQLFRPVQPMLAQTAEDVTDALQELGGEAALEYKFDGARVQAHKSGEEVKIYSRGANDVSAAVPEIVEAVRSLPSQELILDGEVLSFDPAGRPQPFQISMRRFGRKVNIAALLQELPMTPVWFDLLYLNGGSLIDEPQAARFRHLSELVPNNHLVPHLSTESQDRGEDFLHQALASGHEGIMAKARNAVYAAGSRGQSWLKIKQARTLDLVILAAEWGNGRRQGWLSNLHLGARDIEKGGFAMLGKTFKGLTDEMLAWQTAELQKIEIARDRYTVFVEPKIVVEIAFNEIQVSARYVSGLALRFARVKRYRPDKTAADSDTFQTVQKLAGLPVAG
ncbi:MAG TPA: ATP-dependent DNA ligase [Bryobacteraceae bacterium]|jgi:DNA ligase-1|nr:ATP-dependent DNA ligase [Bryobacteraceae bacterium]